MEDWNYQAEYAKSNRASCKGCKNLISKDSLRLAVLVQSHHFDGKVPNWYHSDCFFKVAKARNIADIKDYDKLRWEDQDKIQKKLGGGADGNGVQANMNDYVVEYAKSNRSKCRACEEAIMMKSIRVSIKDYESERGAQMGGVDRWHHLDCFVKDKDELVLDKEGFEVTNIPGFKLLVKDDQELLKSKIVFPKNKKRKLESGGDEPNSKKSKDDEASKLKEQSKLLWGVRDKLKVQVTKDALIGLLEYNSQFVPVGESNLQDLVSDMLVFGALSPCPECKAPLKYSSGGYSCTGMATEWTKCLYETKDPIRRKCKIPEAYTDVDLLAKYEYVKRTRVLNSAVQSKPHHSSLVSSAAQGGVSAARPDKPLAGMKFAIAKGPFTQFKSKKEMEQQIKSMGGLIVTKVDKTSAAVIASQAEVDCVNDGKAPLVTAARTQDVHVVSEAFVNAVSKGGAILLIQSHSIAPWGADPSKRIGSEQVMAKSVGVSNASDVKAKKFASGASTQKLQVKGGAAVDPESELADEAHVLMDKNTKKPLSAVLNMVDLVRGSNSYYKLQVLKSDTRENYWVFRSWGRIGTTIGGNKTENFKSADRATQNFMELFEEKTGNVWGTNLVKRPNKFFPVELDFGEECQDIKLDMSKSNSSLPMTVQDLIRFIFDIESMKAAMLEFEIDLKKMPLGKLSRSQIDKAYGVLGELSQMATNGGTTSKFLDASTRFYSLIPHDFGMRRPPLLDTADVIKSKLDMLDNLVEIEVAYSLMKGTAGEDPIDSHYAKLNSKIVPLDKKSEEFERLVRYARDTHCPTHRGYELVVEEIFEVLREGERSRYRPFKKLDNKMLLWHGSRRTNWAGILSQGLRIAPPEAPVTGYMFGKGVYFADMVSKSANYCFVNRSDPHGLLLLCEVALGTMAERTTSDSNIKLNPGEHSCKGIGKTFPSRSTYYTNKEGVVYPIGKPETVSRSTSLLYNEYIVYDVAQVEQKYILKTKFVFK